MTTRLELEDLKIHLLTSGVSFEAGARARVAELSGGKLSVHEYPTTGGVTLDLGSGVLVNAPFDHLLEDPRCRLVLEGGSLLVVGPTGTVPVENVLPLPGYLGNHGHSGRLIEEVAMSHADRLRLSPIVGCAYQCRFCDLGTLPYKLRPTEQLLEAMDLALDDKQLPSRHVLISGGSPRRAHYDDFLATCAAIITKSPLPVDVMFSPMVNMVEAVDRLVEIGVAGFAINLELQSGEAALKELGAKFRTSRRWFEATLVRAVELLGRDGSVRSLIIPGLEPLAETLAGVGYLASLGVDPVLSPFRPTADIALADHPPPSAAEMRDLLDASRVLCAGAGVALGPSCAACQHNTLSFPWDLRSEGAW